MITKQFTAWPTRIRGTQIAAGIVRTTWLSKMMRLVGQCALLWLVFTASGFVVQVTHLPLPQNLVALLMLLLLLTTGVVRAEQLAEVAALVGKHLAFFFVPLVVGIMAWTDLLAAHGLILVISIAGSTVLGVAITGVIAQIIGRRRQ